MTAVGTDSAGATTVSAPVGASIFTVPQQVQLAITRMGTNFQLSWPTSATAASLHWCSNSLAPPTWRLLTNNVSTSNDQCRASITNGGALDQIPRYGGRFYWRQVYGFTSAGCTMLCGAMFDELNEGTSMFKMAPTTAQLPTPAALVPPDMDGQALPSDWYLRLAGQASSVLQGQIPIQPQMPITP